MAKEAFYFSHDCNARNDEKILSLRMKYGAEGYAVYFMILERLMESSNYIHVKDYNVIAFDLRVSNSIVKEIIESFGLFEFTEDGNSFYSESFNRRMKPLDNIREQRRLAGKKSAEKRAKNNSRPTTVQRPLPENPTKESKVEESKVKEKRKEKENSTSVEQKKAEELKKLAAAKAATIKRREIFYTSLVPYVDRYSPEMIRAFYDYWSELNKSETKMKFELNKTWELGKRLATWAKNDYDGQRKSNTSISKNGPDNRRITGRSDAENKRKERDHLGALADAILQCSSTKNDD